MTGIKKIFTFAAVCIGITGCLFFIGKVGYYEDIYYRDGVITKIENGIIYIKDTRGYIWSFYSDEYNINDKVVLTMKRNHNSSLVDDTIEKIEIRTV